MDGYCVGRGHTFFVTALGNPQWVVDKAHAYGGIVYHNITTRKWAERALKAGVDGLICVNDNAGGHAGTLNAAQLFEETKDLGVPILCAGGIGDAQDMSTVLDMGYQGVQLGTRFIAAEECVAHSDYKDSIVNAEEKDIVLTDKISGVPCAIIETELVKKMGAKAGPYCAYVIKRPAKPNIGRVLIMRCYRCGNLNDPLGTVWGIKIIFKRVKALEEFTG